MDSIANFRQMEQSQQAKRMTLAEWRASRVHEHILPSGLPVQLRDISMTDLMLTGRLPDSIIALAKEAADRGEAEFDLMTLAKNTEDFNQLLNTLTELCLVEPKVGTVADDEHILLAEIPVDDKLAIFAFVNREAEKVKSFRAKQEQPVPTA